MHSKKSDEAVLGLDIGTDSLKVVEGRKEANKICVLDFTCRKFSSSESAVDLISEDLRGLLTSLESQKRIKKSTIHSIISGRKLCIRVIKLPLMPEAELYQAVRSKIRKYISVELEQMLFAFSVLGETKEKGVKKLEVVFMAIQKDALEQHLRLFKLLGVGPQVITSVCFSGWNLIREIGLDQDLPSVMLVNIENQETDLTVYRERRFVFTRNISIGGKDFTNILQGELPLSLVQPAEVKQLWGLGSELSASNTSQKDAVLKIRERLLNEANVLCKEIELTVNHYYQITHGQRIDKCIILGGGSQAAGLVDFLKYKLEVPVEALRISGEKLQLPAGREEEFKQNLPLYAQALAALLVGPKDINLAAQIGRQTRSKIALPLKLLELSKASFVLVLAFVGLGLAALVLLKGMNLYYQRQIKAYEQKQVNLETRTMQLIQMKRKIDILDFERQLYRRLLKENPAYPVIIAEISQAVPEGNIIFDELSFSKDRQAGGSSLVPAQIRFRIAGRMSGASARGSETTRFVLALEKSGYFENISVTINEVNLPFEQGRQAEESGQSNFAIDGVLKVRD